MRDNDPKPYDLSRPDEADRLMREIAGYVLTGKFSHEGTDRSGREHASTALREALRLGFRLRRDGEISNA